MPVLRFRLFGFPIQVLPGYWLFTALLCFGGRELRLAEGFATLAVMFVSVLAHELGHAGAARYFGIDSAITLHTMGGLTAFPPRTQLTRSRDLLISVAGPCAGFLLGGLGFLALKLLRLPVQEGRFDLGMVLSGLVWINLFWSAINLLPVVPFDGGRVLFAALGPSRRRLATVLSLAFGVLAAVGLGYAGYPLGAVLFLSSAVTSGIQLFRDARRPAPLPAAKIDETVQLARKALDHELWDRAEQLSGLVLSANPPPAVARTAWETLLWSRLGRGDARGAQAALGVVPEGLDSYLVAAIHNEAGNPEDARVVLQAARDASDTRVEVTALSIRVLLSLGNAQEAAELTQSALEHVPVPDARRVVEECQALGATRAAAKLSVELAKRSRDFNDAAVGVRLLAELSDAQGVEEALLVAQGLDADRSRELAGALPIPAAN